MQYLHGFSVTPYGKPRPIGGRCDDRISVSGRSVRSSFCRDSGRTLFVPSLVGSDETAHAGTAVGTSKAEKERKMQALSRGSVSISCLWTKKLEQLQPERDSGKTLRPPNRANFRRRGDGTRAGEFFGPPGG